MSNIAYTPRILSVAGAKRYYRASGTSTPQNVYLDVDLATPASNPIVADANGYFAKHYYDPSLPNYRMIHTDGSDPGNDYTLETLLEPIQDDIPASQTESTSFRLKDTAPYLVFEETDQASGNKKWRIGVNGGVLSIDIGDDAEATWSSLLSLGRDDFMQITGSFTGVLTGGTGGSGTIIYQRTGNMVSLVAANAVTCTANANTLTLTGLPAAIRPSGAMWSLPVLMTNNNALGKMAVGSISTGGVVTFYTWDGAAAPSSTDWSSTGETKGLQAGWTLVYVIPQVFVEP